MNFYSEKVETVLKYFNTDKTQGLSGNSVEKNRIKYGENRLKKGKEKGFFKRVIDAVKEPMLLILLFGFAVTFGVALGKFIKTGQGDFTDSIGILAAVVLSVSITLVMEGSSRRAFSALNKIYDNTSVKVLRGGEITYIPQTSLVAGDVMLLDSGDKVFADARLISSESLLTDESALTGESTAVKKDAFAEIREGTPLAERKNMIYSGTFVALGSAKAVAVKIGNDTEIGNIAGEIGKEKEIISPLGQKLARLGKTVTLIGAVCSLVVFILSLVRLIVTKSVTFPAVQNLLVTSIILIVAAVPEGLPTIVAVSLALNMVRLAKENALIKKMIATETAGAVSVICSDKTGTLTENKMKMISLCTSEYCLAPERVAKDYLIQNFVCNSTADLIVKGGETLRVGSGTECALLEAAELSHRKIKYAAYRKDYPAVYRLPFSSENKYMVTLIRAKSGMRALIKGAPEKVLGMCNLTEAQKQKILLKITEAQSGAKRVICFAHRDVTAEEEKNKEELLNKLFGKVLCKEYVYDGYACLADGIRKEAFSAVRDCKRAGIKIKILTGDNYATAFAVAKRLGVAENGMQVVSAEDIEGLDDKNLKKILGRITVIARSTPIIKLRVVKALKEMGEVVAVTGDGINDAPAIRHADVGVAMGKTGSNITKEAADVVLLDDGFATIVKAVSFGRNVYRNLQKFILFQLSVNVSALITITLSAVLGFAAPFNTLQLLWINVIMDGPPALTLGLGGADEDLMSIGPVKRTKSIVSAKMLARILIGGVFIAAVILLQKRFNILMLKDEEKSGGLFTLFILFQLFNAFNCLGLGPESLMENVGKNKIMALSFSGTFLIHVALVQFGYRIFGINPMGIVSWIKTVAAALSIVLLSEAYKFVYRKIKRSKDK